MKVLNYKKCFKPRIYFHAVAVAFPSSQTHTRLDIYVVSINSVQYQHYIMLKRLQ